MSSIRKGIACHIAANLDEEGAFAEGLNPGWGGRIEEAFLRKQRFFPRIRRVRGRAVSLIGEAHTNYYHWLLETLPRIRFLEEWGQPYDWLYVCQKNPFNRESLSLLDSGAAKIIDSGTTPFLRADTLLVPKFLQPREPWVIPWLREKALAATSLTPKKELPRRIYISRRHATSRKRRQ